MTMLLRACRRLSFAASLVFAGSALAAPAPEVAPGCGTLENAYGPFDYRGNEKQLALVERHHFSAEVEHLRIPNAGKALDYTLSAFPNHHRALVSMMNLGIRDKRPKPSGAVYTVECYMIRAERFRNNDPMVKKIFGLFLLKEQRSAEGISKLEAAKSIQTSGDPSIAYNLGLAYLQLGQYDRALENAHEAYRLGFPLPGLKQLLVKAGRWKEPESEPLFETKQN